MYKREKWSENVENYAENGGKEINEINEFGRMACKISIMRVKIYI